MAISCIGEVRGRAPWGQPYPTVNLGQPAKCQRWLKTYDDLYTTMRCISGFLVHTHATRVDGTLMHGCDALEGAITLHTTKCLLAPPRHAFRACTFERSRGTKVRGKPLAPFAVFANAMLTQSTHSHVLQNLVGSPGRYAQPPWATSLSPHAHMPRKCPKTTYPKPLDYPSHRPRQ